MKPTYPQSRYRAALKAINKTRNREDEAMPGRGHVTSLHPSSDGPVW